MEKRLGSVDGPEDLNGGEGPVGTPEAPPCSAPSRPALGLKRRPHETHHRPTQHSYTHRLPHGRSERRRRRQSSAETDGSRPYQRPTPSTRVLAFLGFLGRLRERAYVWRSKDPSRRGGVESPPRCQTPRPDPQPSHSSGPCVTSIPNVSPSSLSRPLYLLRVRAVLAPTLHYAYGATMFSSNTYDPILGSPCSFGFR